MGSRLILSQLCRNYGARTCSKLEIERGRSAFRRLDFYTVVDDDVTHSLGTIPELKMLVAHRLGMRDNPDNSQTTQMNH
jgi:hypothetical protein